MRVAALALVALAGLACRRGALQDDAGGTGVIGRDGATGGDVVTADGAGLFDGEGAIDARLPTADANCGVTGVAGGRVPPEILLVLDRSVALDSARWNNFLLAIARTISTKKYAARVSVSTGVMFY
jgi:hypothetical protein